MPAEAEVITGRTLVEIKTGQGRKTASGRAAALDGPTLFQLLGGVLHDHNDTHRLMTVALYQARYGHLAIWDLPQLLHQLADKPVDLPTLRARWAELLETRPVPALRWRRG